MASDKHTSSSVWQAATLRLRKTPQTFIHSTAKPFHIEFVVDLLGDAFHTGAKLSHSFLPWPRQTPCTVSSPRQFHAAENLEDSLAAARRCLPNTS